MVLFYLSGQPDSFIMNSNEVNACISNLDCKRNQHVYRTSSIIALFKRGYSKQKKLNFSYLVKKYREA